MIYYTVWVLLQHVTLSKNKKISCFLLQQPFRLVWFHVAFLCVGSQGRRVSVRDLVPQQVVEYCLVSSRGALY